ncbi:hypothetical protein AA106555_0907 [Neokomagataea thailandica NBRC 106555]|nr:hypothetical protein AA106555_0907 [Neokomagataea thailandica NBRC 106555]
MTAEETAAAVALAPDGVVGNFKMTVCGVGHAEGSVFLDSRKNYRDPRTLIIRVPDQVVQDAGLTTEKMREKYYRRRLQVSGWARRIKISVYDSNGVEVRTYNQVQVAVKSLEAIDVNNLDPRVDACHEQGNFLNS